MGWWGAAVNVDGTYGKWRYAVVKKVADIPILFDSNFGNLLP
ncbi:protein of unknown function [Candidatus Nitrospira inopinata]|jgi:hypothetical protein|uniref:Uncharacterized protein n=1 Tax=Candidatus Nitrospira inopinata TaxID=1715989 RepID=A0A0S4KYI1_9BACT|nr:protein of unknown function [Candidatus Nitrospira inopinata]